jgi:UDP-N-acetylglucosamine 2-epimerase (non-hydrolysing)
LFAPTQNSKENLLKEGIEKNKISVTGNTIVDALFQSLSLSASNSILEQLELKPNNYILATIHRQENVDEKNNLSSIIEALNELPAILNIPVIFPVHPRTKAKITQSNLATNNISLIGPLDYFSFLHLENNAALVLTDSGGIQEECCILKVPCVTLRNNTERPETIEVGANVLAGTENISVIKYAGFMIKTPRKWINPFGNGHSAQQIIDIISGGNNG